MFAEAENPIPFVLYYSPSYLFPHYLLLLLLLLCSILTRDSQKEEEEHLKPFIPPPSPPPPPRRCEIWGKGSTFFSIFFFAYGHQLCLPLLLLRVHGMGQSQLMADGGKFLGSAFFFPSPPNTTVPPPPLPPPH